jgi:hypothetical protein
MREVMVMGGARELQRVAKDVGNLGGGRAKTLAGSKESSGIEDETEK